MNYKNLNKHLKNKIVLYVGILVLTIVMTACSNEKHTTDKEKHIQITTPANSTLEELGASVLLGVKKKDPDFILGLLPSKEDVEAIVSNYGGNEKKRKKYRTKWG